MIDDPGWSCAGVLCAPCRCLVCQTPRRSSHLRPRYARSGRISNHAGHRAFRRLTGGNDAEEEQEERGRSEEHTSELQSRSDLVCRLLLEKKKQSHNYRGLRIPISLEGPVQPASRLVSPRRPERKAPRPPAQHPVLTQPSYLERCPAHLSE